MCVFVNPSCWATCVWRTNPLPLVAVRGGTPIQLIDKPSLLHNCRTLSKCCCLNSSPPAAALPPSLVSMTSSPPPHTHTPSLLDFYPFTDVKPAIRIRMRRTLIMAFVPFSSTSLLTSSPPLVHPPCRSQVWPQHLLSPHWGRPRRLPGPPGDTPARTHTACHTNWIKQSTQMLMSTMFIYICILIYSHLEKKITVQMEDFKIKRHMHTLVNRDDDTLGSIWSQSERHPGLNDSSFKFP